MKINYRKCKLITLFLAQYIYLNGFLFAVEIKELIGDTQKISQNSNEMNLVWWIPTEFWKISFKKNEEISNEKKKKYIKVMDQYSLFIVLSAYIGPMGEIFPKDVEILYKNIELKYNNKKLIMLEDSKVNSVARDLLVMMKPLMTKMLGQFGHSMEFILFENIKDKKKIIDPREKGAFEFELLDKRFHWQLPLISLLPKKTDIKTKEVFPGNYNYNPYNGNKLI